MLPAHTKELLTAAVDGELNSAEKRMVEKLLRESREARDFHAGISADAARIRKLSPAFPHDDLARNVMNIIADRAMSPTPLPMPRRQRFDMARLVPWISIATAASVILMVSVSAYIFISANQKQAAQQAAADKVVVPPLQVAKERPKEDKGAAVAKNDQSSADDQRPTVPEEGPSVAKVDIVPVELETLPDPRVVGPDRIITTASLPDNVPIRVVQEAALPWIMLPLKDLDQAYPSKTTRDELKKGEVIRIDLFCKDSARATEIVQAALKGRGHQIQVDVQAADRIKRKAKGDLVVYTESFTADEIAQLLEFLGAEDRKAEKKSGEGQFDKFMLAPFHPADLAELARLLGVPASQIKLPKPKAIAPIDPRGKSLENITASQLAQNLPKSASRGSEKMSVVLPYSATFFPHNSREVKAYLEKRGERKAGAVPVMLVLRTLN